MVVPDETLKASSQVVLFRAIVMHQNEFIAAPKEVVAIPSVSSELDRRTDCVLTSCRCLVDECHVSNFDVHWNVILLLWPLKLRTSSPFKPNGIKSFFFTSSLKKLEEVGVSIQVIGTGKRKLYSGAVIDLPAILFETLSPETMRDLVWIFSQLIDLDGTVGVTHIYDLEIRSSNVLVLPIEVYEDEIHSLDEGSGCIDYVLIVAI
ncbi:unnamed protein product [Angiostrongylus costaricensis]|uniref:DUF4283 domain-containing protein n=1 Tax=Angiostrongylus costaricensis TaxID=334426 RepID=A0A0R3PPG3_ANGCS|nr:unnamed protein product [Angiostrongylus costaricensis]